MRKYSDQTMLLELMTRRLTYSVQLSPAYCQFPRLGLDLSSYEPPPPVKLYQLPPPTNGVSFGKIGTQETYAKTTFQRQFIAKRQKAKTAAKEKMSEENVKAALGDLLASLEAEPDIGEHLRSIPSKAQNFSQQSLGMMAAFLLFLCARQDIWRPESSTRPSSPPTPSSVIICACAVGTVPTVLFLQFNIMYILLPAYF